MTFGWNCELIKCLINYLSKEHHCNKHDSSLSRIPRALDHLSFRYYRYACAKQVRIRRHWLTRRPEVQCTEHSSLSSKVPRPGHFPIRCHDAHICCYQRSKGNGKLHYGYQRSRLVCSSYLSRDRMKILNKVHKL